MSILFNVYKSLFDNYNSFALLQKILEFFMAFYGSSPVIICSYLFLKQKLCVFVSAVPYRLVEIANWFSFLSASFRGGLNIFHGSIIVSYLC